MDPCDFFIYLLMNWWTPYHFKTWTDTGNLQLYNFSINKRNLSYYFLNNPRIYCILHFTKWTRILDVNEFSVENEFNENHSKSRHLLLLLLFIINPKMLMSYWNKWKRLLITPALLERSTYVKNKHVVNKIKYFAFKICFI